MSQEPLIPKQVQYQINSYMDDRFVARIYADRHNRTLDIQRENFEEGAKWMYERIKQGKIETNQTPQP
jgi:hypothetical protein